MDLTIRGSFFETVNQSDNLVEHQFFVYKVCVLIQTVETFSFELESIFLFDILPQFTVDLGSFHDFDWFRIELLNEVGCISWFLAIE